MGIRTDLLCLLKSRILGRADEDRRYDADPRTAAQHLERHARVERDSAGICEGTAEEGEDAGSCFCFRLFAGQPVCAVLGRIVRFERPVIYEDARFWPDRGAAASVRARDLGFDHIDPSTEDDPATLALPVGCPTSFPKPQPGWCSTPAPGLCSTASVRSG